MNDINPVGDLTRNTTNDKNFIRTFQFFGRDQDIVVPSKKEESI